MIQEVQFPTKLYPIFQPKRYKILYGGRGGSKSWAVARALLVMGSMKPLRILCARELQKSIKDSVHRLLSDQINNLYLSHFYEVQHATIKGINGTEFFFEGLRHNTHQIKSYEGVDICWVEEAQTVSKSSWDLLVPTIRKEESEIWITFNPELEEDETYQRFVLSPPENSIVIKVNHADNPWFPEVLKQEMEELKKRDYNSYLTVWEGHCRQAVEGAIFEDEMHKLQEEGRITSVPYEPKMPVNTFWDLGFGDQTAIWFVQKVGFEYRIIDYYQNARKKLQHYLEVLQSKGYIYGTDYLPHDGNNNHLTGLTVEETMKGLGRKVKIVPRVSLKVDALNAARDVMAVCHFDKMKCADGLQCLRRYRYKLDPDTGRVSKEPLHDENSNGSDAFQTFATAKNVMWSVYVGDSQGVVTADYDPFAEDRL